MSRRSGETAGCERGGGAVRPVVVAFRHDVAGAGAVAAVILEGDCIDVMAGMDEASVDAIVCDPPYGLGFMGRAWDALPPGLPWARECLRVLKPGGHLLAFGGTRTVHRLACAVEDAGFEIRDTICWLYGSGFPKSLDVSKAIDKQAGAARKVVGRSHHPQYNYPRTTAVFSTERRGYDDGTTAGTGDAGNVTAPATPDAERWDGWGTALKPAHEPIVVARRPLAGTVAANVLAHGTGAINVDGCRVGATKDVPASSSGVQGLYANGHKRLDERSGMNPNVGRWPANVVLDEDAAALLDEQTGELTSGDLTRVNRKGWRNEPSDGGTVFSRAGDSGGASRFFYCAKASRRERNNAGTNQHPTVKPVALMQWLVRLVTPPGGTVLDPFAGSGTTGIAAAREGFRFIGIEREAEYAALARARIAADFPLAEAS